MFIRFLHYKVILFPCPLHAVPLGGKALRTSQPTRQQQGFMLPLLEGRAFRILLHRDISSPPCINWFSHYLYQCGCLDIIYTLTKTHYYFKYCSTFDDRELLQAAPVNVESFVSEYFFAFRHYKVLRVHLVFFLFQSWNQLFLWETFVSFTGNGIRNQDLCARCTYTNFS